MANVNFKLINKPNQIIGVINQLSYASIDNKKKTYPKQSITPKGTLELFAKRKTQNQE